MDAPAADQGPAAAQALHWRRTRAWTAALLVPWFVVGFVTVYFARELDVPFLGWPFGFWMAGQGALLVFVGIVWVFASAMDRLDRTHGHGA